MYKRSYKKLKKKKRLKEKRTEEKEVKYGNAKIFITEIEAIWKNVSPIPIFINSG